MTHCWLHFGVLPNSDLNPTRPVRLWEHNRKMHLIDIPILRANLPLLDSTRREWMSLLT